MTPILRAAAAFVHSFLRSRLSRQVEILALRHQLAVIAWRRRKLREHWTELIHSGKGQQIVEAFPWDETPRLLLRDRDKIYGATFRRRVGSLGVEEVLIAPRSPWQSPYVERLIGSIRRECLDHMIVVNERHLKRILTDYFRYYHRWRTHQSLGMDCPERREVHAADRGLIVEIDEVGGLHHHYERAAA